MVWVKVVYPLSIFLKNIMKSTIQDDKKIENKHVAIKNLSEVEKKIAKKKWLADNN